MKKHKDMLSEYDFTGGVRGKYAKRYAKGTNIVVLSPDMAKVFPVSRSQQRGQGFAPPQLQI